jgi:uncharacterized protein
MLIRVFPLVIVLLSALVGCGTTPPSTFYRLEPLPTAAGSASGQTVIGVGPLGFPEYLKRPQIVTFGPGEEVTIAGFNRWAEPVTASFQRVLSLNLDSLIEDTLAIRFPFGGGLVSVDYRLLGEITRFDVDSAGTATLDVSWLMKDAEDQTLIPVTRSVFHATAATVTDYDQVVAAMNQTLQSFSREVAQRFESARNH